MQALDRLIQCIDHAAPNYRNQCILVESDVAHVLLEFLNDESEAVGVKAARVIAALTDHCASSKVRLYSGVTALENQSCNILFNPVQDYFLDAIATLVPWTVDVRQIKSATAMEALSNICHFNKNGKIVLIEYLCQYIDDGANITYLELLDRTVASIDTIDEELANLLRPRCLALVHRICHEQSLDSERITLTMSLISTLCEKDSSLRFDLVDAGGVLSVMEIFLRADILRVKDAAVNTLWQMTLDNTKTLVLEALHNKEKEFVLGVMASLRQVIQAGEDSHEEEDLDEQQQQPHCSEDIDSCMEMSATVDYDEEAKKLLDMILTKYNDEGDDMNAANEDQSAQCSIM